MSSRSGTRRQRAGSPGRSVPGRRFPRRAGPGEPRQVPSAAPGRWRSPAVRAGGCAAAAAAAAAPRGHQEAAGVPGHPPREERPPPAAARVAVVTPSPRPRRCPAVPSSRCPGPRVVLACLPVRAGPAAGVMIEDRGQVALTETGADRRVPERPVNLRRSGEPRGRDRGSHLDPHPPGTGRGGLGQPQPAPRYPGRGTRPPRRCGLSVPAQSAPAGAAGKCSSSSCGLPGVARAWRATSAGPGLTDVHDDDLLIFPGAMRTDPDRLPQQGPGHRVLPALEGHHRRLRRHGPGHPERDRVRHRWQRVQAGLLLGEHVRGHPAGHPVHPAVDLPAERLAGRLQGGEEGVLAEQVRVLRDKDPALASFTVDSEPPLLAGSAGSQV